MSIISYLIIEELVTRYLCRMNITYYFTTIWIIFYLQLTINEYCNFTFYCVMLSQLKVLTFAT